MVGNTTGIVEMCDILGFIELLSGITVALDHLQGSREGTRDP